MYAVVGFCSPATIFWKLSSLAEIVQSALADPPSETVSEPSVSATVHVPAPSISKTYVLFIPAIRSGLTRAGSPSKNSCTVPMFAPSLLRSGRAGA